MKIYFLRHADALPGTDDDSRPLSELGEKQSRELGRFLRKTGIGFDAAYSSPLVRAKETADIVLDRADSLSRRRLQLVDALKNEVSQAQFDRWLSALPDVKHLLLVGHAPTLAERVRRLVHIGGSDALNLAKGALACVDTGNRRTGALKFLITPKLLGVRPD